ncbi:MAG: ABC transporter ATP-binding protein [Methanobacteriaceae archaeon]
MHQLEIQNLTKIYEGKKVLEDINLYLEKGTTLGLIGPTGCGKTTLLRIIDLLEKPSSGKIFLDGVDIFNSKLEPKEIRRRIGMVFQKPIVFNGTVYENIRYGLKIRGESEESYEEEIANLLDSLGLTGYENREASTLSGGETQRIALARALITEPDLLLLDEPTANLDPLSTEKIENLIVELSHKKQTTIIMATHNLIQGQKLSDQIAILNKKIFQRGTPEEVFLKPAHKFVAEFVGVKNVKKGVAKRMEPDLTRIEINDLNIYSTSSQEGEVYLSIRPEDITISSSKVETSALNRFHGKIKEIKDNGGIIEVLVDVGDYFTIFVTRKSFSDMGLTVGSPVWIEFKANSVNAFEN